MLDLISLFMEQSSNIIIIMLCIGVVTCRVTISYFIVNSKDQITSGTALLQH